LFQVRGKHRETKPSSRTGIKGEMPGMHKRLKNFGAAVRGKVVLDKNFDSPAFDY
jgi:hypothetical protein